MKITAIPALSDNYIWLIEITHQAIIIDPAVDQPVCDYLAEKQLKPIAILLTHNHADHTDGVNGILAQYPDLAVIGTIECQSFTTQTVRNGDQFELLGQKFDVFKTAGHTAEHISFLMNREQLFCGDALFSAGCGRVFTEDYQAQFEALQCFNALPDFVEVYPAHEYTQSNLKFARHLNPTNCVIAEYQERADILRSQGKPTLPTTIGIEKQINPFLQSDNLAEFIALRKQKDRF